MPSVVSKVFSNSLSMQHTFDNNLNLHLYTSQDFFDMLDYYKKKLACDGRIKQGNLLNPTIPVVSKTFQKSSCKRMNIEIQWNFQTTPVKMNQIHELKFSYSL